jgi:leucyl-tRNA synthetase
VLANEEIIDGLSERGAFPVERLPLRQWVLHITQCADELEAGLQDVDWPEGTVTSQKQWIGRSTGATVSFAVQGRVGEQVDVFTTRVDTLMGATYVVLAPENPLVIRITSAAQEAVVAAYRQRIAGKSDLERTDTGADRGKTGVFTGAYVVHPVSGAPLPVWVADYVLPNYGTGSVMAVPAHDDRDYEFATKFDLPILRVVQPADGEEGGVGELPFTAHGQVCASGPGLDGLSTADAQRVVTEQLAALGAGGAQVNYKLRDWVFSRQRYWGEPIPIYFPVTMLTEGGEGSPAEGAAHEIDYDSPHAVPESELPLRLPAMGACVCLCVFACSCMCVSFISVSFSHKHTLTSSSSPSATTRRLQAR